VWRYRLRVDGHDYNSESYEGTMPWEVHHLLGEVAPDDVRFEAAFVFKHASADFAPDAALAEPEAWTALLSLHADDAIGLDILDAGSYTVLVPLADLRAGSFERAVCVLQSS
jgi:hypothetical protein